MISIIIPAYEARAELPMCLASMLAQSYEDWECVVVDDGSSEPLDDLVEGCADPRIRLIRHAVNRGRGAARATGLAAAARPLVAWQDADDWSFPGRLTAQMCALEASPRASVVGTAVAVTDAGGRCVGVRGDHSHGPRHLRPLQAPPVVHPTLLMRREVVARIGYRERFRTAEDHDFLSRALVRYGFVNIGEPLYAYREAPSQSLGKYWQSIRTRVAVAMEHAPRYPVRAAGRLLASAAKLGVYAVASTVGAEGRLIAARSRAPRADELDAYEAALSVVVAQREHCFGGVS